MLNKSPPQTVAALSELLDRIDGVIRASGYAGDPVQMYLAGGLAVNHYCGVRPTGGVDASFSRLLLLPFADLLVTYVDGDGMPRTLYLDPNYNSTFAVMHEDHEADSIEWEGIGNDRRLVRLRVLSPVDVAVSKVARFLDHDQDDILAMAREGLVTAQVLRSRCEEALSYYVGNVSGVRASLENICRRIDQLGEQDSAPDITPEAPPASRR